MSNRYKNVTEVYIIITSKVTKRLTCLINNEVNKSQTDSTKLCSLKLMLVKLIIYAFKQQRNLVETSNKR